MRVHRQQTHPFSGVECTQGSREHTTQRAGHYADMAAAVFILLSLMDFYLYTWGDPSVELSVVPSEGKSDLQKLLCTGTGFDLEIKWLPNSGNTTGASSKVTMDADGHVKVSSEIEVALDKWNQGEEFFCQVTDLQEMVEKSAGICAAHPAAPLIHLEKPRLFNPSLQPHSAVTASCVVEAAPNSRVSWVLSGNVEKKASKETKGEQLSSSTRLIVSKLTLPAREWEQHQNVTCRVKQPCDEEPEEKTVNILANYSPTVHLVEFGQTIACVIEDFYPKDIHIKWKKNDREVRGRDWISTENDSGFYRAVSVLEADLTPSSLGTKYTCEVTHRGSTYTESLSSRDQFSLKINPPQAKDLFINRKAELECVLTGDSRKEVEGATVSWTVGGNPATRDVRVGGVTQAGSSFTKTSTLTLEESVWFSGDEVICSTSVDQRKTSDKISVKKGETPSVIIYKPHKSVLVTDMVSLVCEVSSSDLTNVYVMWQVNGGQYIEGHSMTSMKKDNTLTVLSYLTVPGQQYNRAEFACAVKHANMENSYTLTTRTTSMRKANCQAPAIINFKIKLQQPQERAEEYVSDTFTYIRRVEDFSRIEQEWSSQRESEMKKMRDFKCRSDTFLISFQIKRLENELGAVGEGTLKAMEELQPVRDEVEKQAVTSPFVFNTEAARSLILAARTASPLLINFKRDAFSSPNLDSVDILIHHLHKYICLTKWLCQEMNEFDFNMSQLLSHLENNAVWTWWNGCSGTFCRDKEEPMGWPRVVGSVSGK
ncbi:hypothetical protein AOLI_G00175980 [Acnodon oligacanthus]